MPPGECQVWWARPLTGAGPDPSVLDPIERGRAEAYRKNEDRARFTVAASLLRLVAGAHLGVEPRALPISRACPDCDRPHGRPTLPADGWECSVSHSGDRVAVAIGRTGPLGVDVEEITDRPDVRDLVLAPDQDGELVTYWVRKEAVLKATGEGLRVALTEVVVTSPDDPPALVRAHRADLPARTTLRTLQPGDGYRACLAALDTPGLVVTELSAG
ncbi:4'-phosphopantetheinyl transferase superfamily protein [Cryptosporangium phraense]|uniref:4'-phosphopantetheinyl transferase superfamily protein n=1 Tax=Cryptosporangium phraense TaxID=2593070 RepID=A0A545AQU2_9ACTN|nr:4'-phosphopantetheinyl transferase superfamily protein [Cryptosporangium phraense]